MRNGNITRQAVVAEALSWEGTNYHPMARVKCKRDASGKIVDRGGVDCAMIVLEVYKNVGAVLPEDINVQYYAYDWHLHQDAQRYLLAVLEHAREIPEEEAGPGDMVLFRWGRLFSHGGIIIDPGWPNIIHAYNESQCVIRDLGTSGRLLKRERKFFTIWYD